MRFNMPIMVLAFAAILAFGAGCAEDSDLFGGSGGRPPSSSQSPDTTPSPSGSGLVGGIR